MAPLCSSIYIIWKLIMMLVKEYRHSTRLTLTFRCVSQRFKNHECVLKAYQFVLLPSNTIELSFTCLKKIYWHLCQLVGLSVHWRHQTLSKEFCRPVKLWSSYDTSVYNDEKRLAGTNIREDSRTGNCRRAFCWSSLIGCLEGLSFKSVIDGTKIGNVGKYWCL